jgi:hypothetical protein
MNKEGVARIRGSSNHRRLPESRSHAGDHAPAPRMFQWQLVPEQWRT